MDEQSNGKREASSIAQEEAKVGRLVWLNRAVIIALTTAMVVFIVSTQAHSAWHYVADPLAAAVPLTYGMLAFRHVRLRHVSVLRSYHSQLVMRSLELQEMAARDELTQLYNRRYFYQQLRQELDRARTRKQPLALVLLDIDGLKAINDDCGHQTGDAVIASLARIICRYIRAADTPARLGGDEFGILMPDTDKRGAFGLARRLLEELEHTPAYEKDGAEIKVGVSVGVSGFPWGGEDVDEVMHWADTDLYANKMSRKLPAQPLETVKVSSELNEIPDFD
ncbi:MAG: GGDEF domain-containing protein [Chloroflexi bacterium]|nr:GGDEF domain-containing protein [Chloroflexota bacterium]